MSTRVKQGFSLLVMLAVFAAVAGCASGQRAEGRGQRAAARMEDGGWRMASRTAVAPQWPMQTNKLACCVTLTNQVIPQTVTYQVSPDLLTWTDIGTATNNNPFWSAMPMGLSYTNWFFTNVQALDKAFYRVCE